MAIMKKETIIIVLLVLFASLLPGCGTMKKVSKPSEAENEIEMLKNELNALKAQKAEEIADLERAKKQLEGTLKKEIGEYKAKLEMTERGLVVTFLSEVFFDSGKDVIRENGEEALKNVAQALNSKVPDSPVSVEGHTDNDPIKYSGWKSNWELSAARALSVLHYLIDKGNVKPERLSAVGCGEYKPVASNETAEGRQKNRRVEIVILPSKMKKVIARD